MVAVANAANYEKSTVDHALDELMLNLNYDFTDFIKPGMNVFIKPNWVASRWRDSAPHKDTLYSVITHPAVIEAVADRAAAALDGKGKIIIGDNPSIDANFEELMNFTGIKKLETKYNCKIIDLRPLICKDLADYGKKNKMHRQQGDPQGSTMINLGKESLFYNIAPDLFRGVFDEREDTIRSHTGDTQVYSFSRSIYDADVYISIPKLKTHHKTGVTLNLKGLVGSIADKNQLVHWRMGSPETGGDEYPDLKTLQEQRGAKISHRGSHPGNDTIWRMVVDLYTAFRKKERRYFSLIDGIVAGEGKGPFYPHAKNANVLIAGADLLTVDLAATKFMGIDPLKIKYLEHFAKNMDLDAVKVIISGAVRENFFGGNNPYLDFEVPKEWKGVKTVFTTTNA